MKYLITLLATCFMLNFQCSSTQAAAPAPVPQTGQTISYYARDDGALQPGVAWPVTRFSDHANGTVTDNLTGLIWTKDANLPLGTKTWQLALDYVAAMNAGSTANFGYTDWRLPSILELHGLVDSSRSYPALPTGHPFTSVQILNTYGQWDFYWSATSNALVTSSAWVVGMYSGYVNYNDKLNSNNTQNKNFYVWPVRSGQSGSVAKNMTSGTSYTSLDEALKVARTGDEIRMLDATLPGPFTLNTGVLLSGGWNATYQGKSGLPTTLSGDLNVAGGDSSAETVVVVGTVTLQAGSLKVKGVTVK